MARSAGEPSSGLKGDINGDGRVDILDVQLCVNVVLGLEDDPAIAQAADVNEDGVVNVLDVQWTANIFLGVPTPTPVPPTGTATAIPTPTDSPTLTLTASPAATLTPTSTPPPPTPSPTPTPSATLQPTPTSTRTPVPSLTSSPTATFTPTSTPVPPTPSSTPSSTPQPTATPTSTDTPSPPTATATYTPTETAAPTTATPTPSPTPAGSVAKWSKLELEFTGPASTGMSDTQNPFKILVDVTFVGPSGRNYVVPAFYDGDGNGGLDGNVWRVRFSPDQTGTWTYTTASAEPLLDGHSGSFDVTNPVGCSSYVAGGLPDFACVGRLEYAGEHYPKFADGAYWLKGGADDPEDFLGPGVTVGFATKEEAVDFLADHAVNSMYIMLQNVDGDGRNVWPWVGSSQTQAKANHEHFDVAKLGEWEQLFSYIQSSGLVLHLVLEDDSGWAGFNRSMYYREMIARFAHHNGIIWNIAEEYQENYSSDQVKSFAQMLRGLDPYGHPITVHHAGSTSAWDPFLGDARLDLTSFQTSKTPQNPTAASWFAAVENSGRVIPISFDETGKLAASDRDLARHILWSVYLGGGMFELHTSPLTEYQDFAAHFDDMTRARSLIEQHPYWQLQPANEILISGSAYIFADAGELYMSYLPTGGSVHLDLSAAPGTFQAVWFDPASGAYSASSTVSGGGVVLFTSPFNGDVVLIINR